MKNLTTNVRRINFRKSIVIFLLSLCVLLFTFSCISSPGEKNTAASGQDINTAEQIEKTKTLLIEHDPENSVEPVQPGDPRYLWDGRIDFSNPSAPFFTWSGAAVMARFKGSVLSVHFGQGRGQNWFNLIVDEKIYIFNARNGKTYTLKEGLTEGEHNVLLFKRSEAQSGKIAFLGFSVLDGELLEAPPPRTRRLEFLGDSITAGACNEDIGTDQWDDRSTHNFYNSYAAITARNLNASLVATVNSGSGICIGWSKELVSEFWNRQDVNPSSAITPPADPAPDAFIINLGENDQSYTSAKGLPFPEDFTEQYMKLVRMIRERYPSTLIICSVGGMSAGHPSSILSGPWEQAMETLMADDNRVRAFRFETSSWNHPRVPAHREMAGELTVFLCQELGWERIETQ